MQRPIRFGCYRCAGASTAAPLSKSIPKAPVDLVGLYLLAVLETDEGGNAPVVSIRALRDRDATCRCLLIGMGEEVHGARVYVSPGYGGGVFVVAADGGGGTCAKIWRGTFDEGDRPLTSCTWSDITIYWQITWVIGLRTLGRARRDSIVAVVAALAVEHMHHPHRYFRL